MIYLFLYGMTLLTITLIQFFVIGSLKTPITFFSGLWCVIGILVNLGLYEMYIPSNMVNNTILIGIWVFFIIFSIGINKKKKSFFREKLLPEDTAINYPIIIMINMICIVFEIPFAVKGIAYLSSGQFAYLRASGSGLVIGNTLLLLINETFVKPTVTATTILCIVNSFYMKGPKLIILVIIAIVENLMFVLVTAGRAPFVNLLFYFIIALVFMSGNGVKEIICKHKKKLIGVLFAFVVVVYFTLMRTGSKSLIDEVLRSMYSYFCCGPIYLSQLLKNYHEYGIEGKLLYGSVTFGFFVNWIILILQRVFRLSHLKTTITILGSVITSRQYQTGMHSLSNAMCTCFYAFVLDWGYIGIIIGPIVVAVMSLYFVNKVHKHSNICNLCMYIYWIYMLIRTTFRWDLVSLDIGVINVMLYIYTKTPPIKIGKKQ